MAAPRWPVALSAAAVALAACVLAAFVVVVPKSLAALAGPDGSGSVRITVATPAGAELGPVRVLVDDASRCTEVPCLVEGVTEGAHVVRVVARGFQPVAGRAVSIADEQTAHIQFSLSPDDETESEEAEDPAPPTEPDDLATEPARRAAPRRRVRQTVRRSKPEPPPAEENAPTPEKTGKATVLITANRPAAAIVDGRPMGKTPLSVQLAAGTHTVVLAHEGTRRVLPVTVVAGEKRALSSTF